MIDSDVVKDTSQQIKQLHDSLFLKTVYDSSLFCSTSSLDRECQLLEKYPINIRNVELLMAMRLKEGFVLTQVASPVNQLLAFSTIIFTLEKRIKKSAVIMYDIKFRRDQKMSSSYLYPRKGQFVPIVNISRLNLKSYGSPELTEMFCIESLRLKTSDEKLVDFVTKLNNARSSPSISPYRANYIKEHNQIIMALNQCSIPTSFHQNFVVTAAHVSNFTNPANSSVASSHQLMKKLVDGLMGVITSYFLSPNVVIMYVLSSGGDDNLAKGKIITAQLSQRHKNFLTLFVSVLTTDSTASISYNDSSSAFSIFTTFNKVLNKLRLRTFTLQRDVYYMLPSSRIGGASFNGGRIDIENINHNEFSYLYLKFSRVINPPFKESMPMIQAMIADCQRMKLELGFQNIGVDSDPLSKNMFAHIKVNEGSISESILHCEITCNSGIFKVTYKIEALYSAIQLELQNLVVDSRSVNSKSCTTIKVENIDVVDENKCDDDNEKLYGIGQCIDTFFNLDDELFSYYSIFTDYLQYEPGVQQRVKELDFTTFRKLQQYAYTESRCFKSFEGEELATELIDRSFDVLCALYSMVPVNVDTEKVAETCAMGFSSSDDMILLMCLSSIHQVEKDSCDSSCYCKLDVYTIAVPYWRSWISEDANVKRQQLMMDDPNDLLVSNETLDRLIENTSRFFDYFDKIYRHAFVDVLFAAHKFSDRKENQIANVDEEIKMVETALHFTDKFSQEVDMSSIWGRKPTRKMPESIAISIFNSFKSTVADNLEPVMDYLYVLYSAPDDFTLVRFSLVCKFCDEQIVEKSFMISCSSTHMREAFDQAYEYMKKGESQTFLKIEFYIPCAIVTDNAHTSKPELPCGLGQNNSTIDISVTNNNLSTEAKDLMGVITSFVEIFVATESLKYFEIEKMDNESAEALQSSLSVIPGIINIEM